MANNLQFKEAKLGKTAIYKQINFSNKNQEKL